MKNGVIGFISVAVLAVATWGIAKAIKKNETPNPAEAAATYERIAPKASPIKIDPNAKRDITITEEGMVKEANTIFPIPNTVEPPAINFATTSTSLVTPSNVIDQNRTELENLLDNGTDSNAPEVAQLSESESMVIESRKLISDFLAAKTLEERLPMIFSERTPAGEIAERFAGTMLDKPIELAEIVSRSSVIYFGQEGPNAEGITQQYFSVVIMNRVDGSSVPLSIVIHMANHHDGKYRINADAFLFCAQNQLEKFVNNEQSAPLIAYLFLERCHYKAGAEESPSGTFSVRLLSDPFTESPYTALVDTMRSSGELLSPVVTWGVPPRAAIVELSYEPNAASGENTITVNRLLKLNWLQSYNATPSEDK